MKRVLHPRRLDLQAWAEQLGREGAESPETLAGDLSAAELERFSGELAIGGADARIHWSARPELKNRRHVQPDLWLHLTATAQVALTCRRCLQAVDVGLEVDRAFRFVRDENLAAAEDEMAEEDVMALDGPLNLIELLEDELIMSLPLAPRHTECPLQLPHSAVDAEFDQGPAPKPPAFAALAALKSSKS